jgi:hypothetical protein
MSIKSQLRPAPKRGGKSYKQDTPPAEHDAEGDSHNIIHDALTNERGKTVRRARAKRAGYITRTRERNEKGQLGGADYVIREQPPEGFTPDNDLAPPVSSSPALEKPTSENPIQVIPTLENPMQLNKDKAITEKSNTDLSNTDSIPFTSYPRERGDSAERKGAETGMSAFEIYRDIIRENIEYEFLTQRFKYDKKRIGEIGRLR